MSKGAVLVATATVVTVAWLMAGRKPKSTRTASGVTVLLPPRSSGLVQGVDFDIDPDTGSIVMLGQGCWCSGGSHRLLKRHGNTQVFKPRQGPSRWSSSKGLRWSSTGRGPHKPTDPLSQVDPFGGHTWLGG